MRFLPALRLWMATNQLSWKRPPLKGYPLKVPSALVIWQSKSVSADLKIRLYFYHDLKIRLYFYQVNAASHADYPSHLFLKSPPIDIHSRGNQSERAVTCIVFGGNIIGS